MVEVPIAARKMILVLEEIVAVEIGAMLLQARSAPNGGFSWAPVVEPEPHVLDVRVPVHGGDDRPRVNGRQHIGVILRDVDVRRPHGLLQSNVHAPEETTPAGKGDGPRRLCTEEN